MEQKQEVCNTILVLWRCTVSSKLLPYKAVIGQIIRPNEDKKEKEGLNSLEGGEVFKGSRKFLCRIVTGLRVAFMVSS